MKTKNIIYGILGTILLISIIVGLCLVSFMVGDNQCKKKWCSDLYEENLIINDRNKTINLVILILSLGISLGLILHGFPFKFESKTQNNYGYDENEI